MTPLLSPSRRVRRTPFSEGVEAAGVRAYTVYNHMLLATVFRSVEEDYHHLKSAVQVWDVSCERQVEIRGPDAAPLVRILTPRDVSAMKVGQCFYLPVVDERGGMLNDPVAVKLADDKFWISIADSDLLFWIKGLCSSLNLNVQVSEPEVFPLAIQGPRADDLMARVFGEHIRELRFFRFVACEFQGHSLVIARSGYSKQGGFEIYVSSSDLGPVLWRTLFEAGEDLDVRAGCPNLIERVEGGLLSYGNDMTLDNTPFECGLGKFCHLDRVAECVGHGALVRHEKEGLLRQIRPVVIDAKGLPNCDRAWRLQARDGTFAGQVTSAAWSPDFDTTVAIAMVEAEFFAPGTELQVQVRGATYAAQVRAEFWI